MVSEKETAAEVIEELSEVEQGVNEAGDEHTSLMKEPKKGTLVLTMVLSFVIPAIIMALAFYNNQIYPGGKNTVLIYDMMAQFAPTYASLRYLGDKGNSIFYTMFGSLGVNAFPSYASYIFDPMSWITVLFSLKKLPDVLYVITLVKIGLCGLGFSVFLLFRSGKHRNHFLIMLLSCCYALMSYNVIYSECLLWLNVVAITPIILLGIDRLMDGKGGILYIFALLIAMIYVFQMTFMAGILAVFYLAYRLTEYNGNRIRKIVEFCKYTGVSLGLYMPICIPTLICAFEGRLKSGAKEEKVLFYYPLLDVLKQFFSCRYDSVEKGAGGLPYVFCGTLTIILVLLFFCSHEKKVIGKLIPLGVILFYLASFCIGPINRMWHGFIEPNSFPCRYSYTLCCFMLILAYEGRGLVDDRVYYLPRNVLTFCETLVFVFAAFELYMNASYVISSLNLEKRYILYLEYDSFVDWNQNLMENLADEGFYRVGRDNTFFTPNDGMFFDYNGIGYFSSFYNNTAMNFMFVMGYSRGENYLEDLGENPVIDSILGVKYATFVKGNYTLGYETIDKSGPYVLARNDHALPLGYIMGNSKDIAAGRIMYTVKEEDGNAFAYQELMLSDIYGAECSIYEEIPYEIKEIDDIGNGRHVQIDFSSPNSNPVWMFCKNVDVEEKDWDEAAEGESAVLVNGEPVLRLRTATSTVCMYLGTFEKGERIHIDAKDVYDFGEPWIVSYSEDECNRILDEIADTGLTINEMNNGIIKGEIYSPKDEEYMLLTLPYMDGYRIKVDGRLTNYEEYRHSLLLVKLTEGRHDIEISFIPKGFIIGLVIGVLSLLVVFVMLIDILRRIYKRGQVITEGQ